MHVASLFVMNEKNKVKINNIPMKTMVVEPKPKNIKNLKLKKI